LHQKIEEDGIMERREFLKRVAVTGVAALKPLQGVVFMAQTPE
jgi:hypothetical protein